MTSANEFASAFDERLAAVSTHGVIEAAESAWPDRFWGELQRDGFTAIGVPESAGGSGGDLSDAVSVLRVVGKHAAPGPWAEAGLLTALLVGDRPALVEAGITTVASGRVAGERVDSSEVRLHGDVVGVPWARAADRVLLVAEAGGSLWLVAVDPKSSELVEDDNLAGEARDTLRLDGSRTHPAVELDRDRADGLIFYGALSRAALIAGAVSRILDLTLEYTEQREQFGRPVARFQLVQRHLVTIAEQAALVTGAVDGAAAAARDGAGRPEIAAAKVVADLAASEVAKAAHQAHGAIGVTREYRLQQLTRRLWSWRSEYGLDGGWASWLGRQVRTAGSDALYPAITDLSVLTQAAS